jgi:hypothetical protein
MQSCGSVVAVDEEPADKGRILATQAMSNVDGILTAQGGVEGVRSDGSAKKHARK